MIIFIRQIRHLSRQIGRQIGQRTYNNDTKSDVIFADLGVGTVIMATIAYYDHLFGDISNGIIIEGAATDYFDSREGRYSPRL